MLPIFNVDVLADPVSGVIPRLLKTIRFTEPDTDHIGLEPELLHIVPKEASQEVPERISVLGPKYYVTGERVVGMGIIQEPNVGI